MLKIMLAVHRMCTCIDPENTVNKLALKANKLN